MVTNYYQVFFYVGYGNVTHEIQMTVTKLLIK